MVKQMESCMTLVLRTILFGDILTDNSTIVSFVVLDERSSSSFHCFFIITKTWRLNDVT